MYQKEDFKNLYSQLEQWANEQGYSGINGLENDCTSKSVANDLYFFRHIRNFLSHNPRAAERLDLTDTFKKDFERLCNSFMVNLNDVAIPFKDIYKREISDTIFPTIKTMKERVFTHVPVMMGKKVWGVFSENTLFDMVGKDEFNTIKETSRFMDIASVITTHDHNSIFDFVGQATSLEDIKKRFSDEAQKGRKLDVLFITTTGKKDGDLTGMITVWDITTM